MLALCLATLASALPADASPALEERFVVGLREVPAELEPGDLWRGGRVYHVDRAIHFLGVATPDAATFRLRLALDPDVRFVEQDHVAFALEDGHADPLYTPNDPTFSSQWGPQKVRANLAWDVTRGSTSASVCIIDTGVRSTHQDVTGSRWMGGFDFVNNDATPNDDNGHGTHVATTAAGTIDNGLGIAGIGNVAVFATKVLNSAGSGSYSGVASGITWCADNAGPRAVLSLSLGGSAPSTVLEDAVDYAVAAGKLVVAASGNGYCSNCVLYPAAYANVLAVGCTTTTDASCDFTSKGPQMGISAPGKDIVAGWHTSNTAYNTISGTSMSTPHVSGAAALYWSLNNAMTAETLKARVMNSAQDLGSAGRDSTFGCGRLDVKALFDGVSNGCVAGGVPGTPTVGLNETFPTTTLPAGWTVSGLWRVTSCRSSSAPNALGYNQGGCPPNYNVGTTSGNAVTRAVTLPATAGAATLTYRSWYQTESLTTYDVKTVDVSTNGGASWTNVDNLQGTTAQSWVTRSVNLQPFVGNDVLIRFRFDTRDSILNDYEGWYVDDVKVTFLGLAAPQSLHAKSGPERGALALGWEPPVLGTPSLYTVYGSATCDGTFEPVGSTDLTNFIEAGLPDATTRCYRVTATIDGLETGPSNTASATTFSPPGPPQALEAALGPDVGTVLLSWAEGADGGAWIEEHRVYRDGALVATLPFDAVSWQDAGASQGVGHEYAVTAVNPLGEGPAATVTGWARGASAPPEWLAAFRDPVFVRLFWGDVPNDGGSPVTTFTVYRDSGSGFLPIAVLPATEFTYEDPGASPLARNGYHVTATNAYGEGPASMQADVEGVA